MSPLLLVSSPHAASRPQQRWQLVHCLLSALCCRGPLGNILQVNWHLTGLVRCGWRGWRCVLGVTSILWRQGLLVCWSTLCVRSISPPPPPSPCVSPPLQPACTPDRQTDVISHASPALGLYHSPQTAHCSHTGCKFRLPLSL